MIKVQYGGQYNSIQDRGRLGFAHYGVPRSGVMDERSARRANLVMRNGSADALLEISRLPPRLWFQSSQAFAVVSPTIEPYLNEDAIDCGTRHIGQKGDVLSFVARGGGWAYLAVPGGFNAPEHFGSRSSYPPAYLGAPYLQTGDILMARSTAMVPVTHTGARLHLREDQEREYIIPVFLGPEFNFLTAESQELIFQQKFQIDSSANRMAYPLVGQRLYRSVEEDILSSPVLPGTVQMLPSGQLVVLMKDAQTTGGYPRVLTIQEKELSSFAQCKLRKDLGFRLE